MARKFTNKMALLIGEEGAGNYGVPPTPYDNTNYQGVIVSAPSLNPTGEKISRDFVRTSFTKTAPNVGRKLNEISFGTELKGNNNDVDPGASFFLHSLLKGCGVKAASMEWVDSDGDNAATMIQPRLFELVNASNCTDFALYENIWVVVGALELEAKVVGLGRRKDSDGDTNYNDMVAVLFKTAAVLTTLPGDATLMRANL